MSGKEKARNRSCGLRVFRLPPISHAFSPLFCPNWGRAGPSNGLTAHPCALRGA